MVICQTDERVLQRQQEDERMSNARPVTSARRKNSRFRFSTQNASMSTASSEGSKSCLVVPVFAKRRSRRNGSRFGSSAASTDQSSTAENIFNPTANNDQQSLLLKSSNQITADWFNEDFAVNQESSPQNAFQPQQQERQQLWPPPETQPTPVVTPTAERQAASLLSFPVPTDRSHNARRQESEQRGMRHAYDGEMEPEGTRGQEATVRNTPQETSPNIPLRDFQGAPRQQLVMGTTAAAGPAPVPSSMPPLPPSRPQTKLRRQRVKINPTPPAPYPLQRQPSDNVSTTSSQDIESLMQGEFSDPHAQYMRPAKTSTENYSRDIMNALQPPGQIASESRETAFFQPSVGSQQHPMSAPLPDDSLSYSSIGKEGSSIGSALLGGQRRSAPVDVDNTSFEAPEQNVQGIHAMAMEHVLKGEYDMALDAFSQVLTVYLEKYGRAHPLTASAYHNLGTVHSKRAGLLLDHTLHQRHCREQALLCFQAAARSARDSPDLGPMHPNVAVSLVRIGFLLLQSRQYQNAVITFQEALRIRLKHYGATHSLVANLYNNLGVCHMHLQEFVVGRRYLQQALDIQREMLEQDESNSTALLELADTLCNIGGLCIEWIRQQGPDARHAVDAETAFSEALQIRTNILGEDHTLTNQVRSLHDMVRSIPASQPSPRGAHSISSMGSPRSPGWPHLDNGSALGRPYATASTPSVSSRSHPSPGVSSRSHPSPGGSRTPEALDLPSLSRGDLSKQRRKEDPPVVNNVQLQQVPSGEDLNATSDRIEPTNRSGGSEISSAVSRGELSSAVSQAELEAYETNEENFLLGTNLEEGQVALVSYLDCTTSLAMESSKEMERHGYLAQARAVLNAHDEYVDSPQLALNKYESATLGSTRNEGLVVDDGLTPLGGTWPKPTEDTITAEVLEDPERHLVTIQNCAADFLRRGRLDESLHLLEIVEEVQRTKCGPLHQDVGAALHNVGIVQLRLGEPYKALQAFEEAVRVRKGALGRDHAHVAASLVKVGISLTLLNRSEDSLWMFREALTVRKHSLGPLHPSTARIYNNIGCVHVEFKEMQEAKRAFDAALDIQRNALVNEPDSRPILFGAATTLQNMAFVYHKRDMYDKEVLVLREALSILEQVFGQSHVTVMRVVENLAEACLFGKQETKALKYYTDYLERLYDRDEATYVAQASIHFKMAKIHKSQNDLEGQLNKLHLATRILRSEALSEDGKELEREIQVELRRARQALEMEELNYV